MTGEEYFGNILLILTGLTFITLVLIFLYMVYGGKEEGTSSSKIAFLKKTSNLIFSLALGFQPFHSA